MFQYSEKLYKNKLKRFLIIYQNKVNEIIKENNHKNE